MSSTAPPPELLTRNLAPLWPILSFDDLNDLVLESQDYKMGLFQDTETQNICLEGAVNGKTVTLGTFPPRYESALTVLFMKWTYFHQLYSSIVSRTVKKKAAQTRRHDLLDDWMRTIVYLDHVFEKAIHWSIKNSMPPPDATCRVLELFLAQEDRSTDHGIAVTKHYDIGDIDPKLITRGEINHPCSIFALISLSADLGDWLGTGSRCRLWLVSVDAAVIERQVNLVMGFNPETSEVSSVIALRAVKLTRVGVSTRLS